MANEAVNATKIEGGAVGTTELAAKGVTSEKLADDAVTDVKLAPEIRDALGRTVDVYVEMTDGQEVTLAESGPLKILARCSLDEGGQDFIRILVASNGGGEWWCFGGANCASSDVPKAPNSEHLITLSSKTTTDSNWMTDIDQHAAVSDGHYIGYDGESLGLGLNLFGNVCLVAGRLHVVSKN